VRMPRSGRGSQPPSRKQFIQQIMSARKGFIAFLPLIVAGCMLVAATAVSSFFYNPSVAVYQCYANAFWYGAKTSQILPTNQCLFLPQLSQYHSLPLEYPPLTLFIFSLPLVVPAASYGVTFALFMGLTVAIIYGLLLRYGPSGAGAFFAACLLAGCLSTTLARFDIVPAAFTLGCLILAERKQWTLAYMALAMGVLMKLYPIVLFPLLFLAEQREQAGFFIPAAGVRLKTVPGFFFKAIRNMGNWRWKNGLMFSGVVLGVTVFFWLVISHGAVSLFSYLYQRPFQVESTGSVLLWLVSIFGIPIDWQFSFGSVNTISPIAGGLSQGFVALLWVGLIFIFIQQWRGKMDLVQAAVAALLVLLATSKVFSPQYILWLIPLLAYCASDKGRMWLIWIGISILTTLIYPFYYAIMGPLNDPSLAPGFMPTIMVRNGLFVLLTIAYLFNFWNMQKRSTIDGLTK
jgi:hypothetical protein